MAGFLPGGLGRWWKEFLPPWPVVAAALAHQQQLLVLRHRAKGLAWLCLEGGRMRGLLVALTL